ncbi:hypothetical protein [Tistrella mobilis]|uniref:hypothetical protein n=1 Tax=Tistrella mobilis TaxID=171437 RepID=UPI0035584F74
MDLYTRLLADLGLPAWISEVRNGHWLVDAMVWEAPADWYTCPPALVPLTSDGSGPRYVGIWVRWTDAGRFLHFVEAGPEDRFLLQETALSSGPGLPSRRVRGMMTIEPSPRVISRPGVGAAFLSSGFGQIH